MVARGIWDAEAAGSSPVTPTNLPHIIVWGVRHDRSVGIDIPVYPSGLEDSLYERGVAWAGKQRS